ncbi:TPA: hypothetical protein DIU27_04110 [Candidatus Collierbacteria bacterium]|uniref:Uncharacterized protein n=1 Tax=Candidatus Collierbacteria bacterium GW2011_GWB2_44_22 TaxID=1618387 RepID=A0A0G1HYI5_9BACT|nr:MAG: hypothetical protein UW31_C0001G0022 [Candidatus Collierbacteria bacterium GW2011_GWA2_44_13]KKT49721.1 MAG: hypothetical protein UW42_C0031G0013 [Candidatus Collierbacteria bacterium GW2011_GWB1_44_197]KKT52211.1 MAG: hypothetical protein UW44_C0003G0054 [Candidatus Collierbacteria bacterium GW2011_GWB2_44_22]KKT62424.1 MAG: hypothetical protein UW56_C0007G0032 [Candidatus Collierbacteria bacterium GW2011_GWD1_44_27]KKT66846.1 MAG: hypothetical protein UW58_C0002G0031 [Candidatus Colli
MSEVVKWTPDEVLRASGETAPFRYQPSFPARFLVENGLIEGRVFDWGCGHGYDVEYFIKNGIEAVGWDPVHCPENPPEIYPQGFLNWIHCAFVLNTLPEAKQRIKILAQIHEMLPENGHVVLTLRSRQELKREIKQTWSIVNDGYVTSKGTFQKGFSSSEAVELLEPLFAEITVIKANPVMVIARK